MIEFFIPGVPVAKGRAKLSTRGGFARAYTPKKTRDYENIVAEYGGKAIQKPLEGPLRVEMVFVMPIPSSLSKKRVDNLVGTSHIKRPDLSNILKCVEDGLNGIAWLDDSQIADLHASKIYGLEPGVVIKIMHYS